jgi:RimJ/RimL family protein N-acetyltransferase
MSYEFPQGERIVSEFNDLNLISPSVNFSGFEKIVSWLNDKNHMRFSNQRFQYHTIETQLDYVEKLRRDGNIYLVAYCGNMLVGTNSILLNQTTKVAEIGILISNQLKEIGFGTKLMHATIAFVENELGIKKIIGGCLSVNTGMKRVFEKCGFQIERIFENEEIFDSKRVDVYLYSKYV